MLSIDGRRCAFGCTYCFASFSDYEAQTLLGEVEADPGLLAGIDLVYPACDTDLFARDDFEDILDRLPGLGCSVSISTKAGLGRRAEGPIRRCQERLAELGQVLKIGVSISTKTMVDEIEPRTPSYRARVRTLSVLQRWGVPRSLAFRPLLSEVPDAEYVEILDECRELTQLVLFGDEWLSRNEPRPTIRLGAQARVEARQVGWLRDVKSWRQRSVPGRVEALRVAAVARGFAAYESDLTLVEDVRANG